eukprot:TRINITY_DN5745_c1_g1_i10.p1 TRINITY_DN5745_c1_g1~~TRINITY_DN5745_c1_g1_i10.p1  ORF type:complete len:215 (-),score=-32.93 TRINITY_DN5745_c1_g1_i10:735-1379(-)
MYILQPIKIEYQQSFISQNQYTTVIANLVNQYPNKQFQYTKKCKNVKVEPLLNMNVHIITNQNRILTKLHFTKLIHHCNSKSSKLIPQQAILVYQKMQKCQSGTIVEYERTYQNQLKQSYISQINTPLQQRFQQINTLISNSSILKNIKNVSSHQKREILQAISVATQQTNIYFYSKHKNTRNPTIFSTCKQKLTIRFNTTYMLLTYLYSLSIL